MEPQVLFVHGVGGPAQGWEGALRRSLARVGRTAGWAPPRLATTTVRYDDVVSGAVGALLPVAQPAPDIPEARSDPRSRADMGLADIVTDCAALPGGTDGRKRVRLPAFLPGSLVCRLPFADMSHAWTYRSDPAVRATARARIAEALAAVGPGPTILIAHSLGSVVALDALHRHDIELDLLVTIGSPLGVDPVWGCAWLGSEDFPHHRVGGWLNVVNTRDPIPWGRGAQEKFPVAVDAFITAGGLPMGPGGAHDPATYLAAPVVGEAVAAALRAYRS